MSKSFFARWFRGTKDYASSPLGVVHSQLIISCFIVFGLFIGSIDMKLRGDGVIAFILFAFGLLQLLSLFSLYKQYKLLVNQKSILSKMKRVVV